MAHVLTTDAVISECLVWRNAVFLIWGQAKNCTPPAYLWNNMSVTMDQRAMYPMRNAL